LLRKTNPANLRTRRVHEGDRERSWDEANHMKENRESMMLKRKGEVG
jgi:hypothetical protein